MSNPNISSIIDNTNTIFAVPNYPTKPSDLLDLSANYHKLYQIQNNINAIDASLAQIKPIDSVSSNDSIGTAISSIQTHQTDVNNIQSQLDNLGTDVYDYWKMGEIYQGHVTNNKPTLHFYGNTLNNQIEENTALQNDINLSKGVTETSKLQLKSYWLQSIILLIIFLIFLWRIIISIYTDKTGSIDIILAVISIVILLYEYWKNIWDPIAQFWNYLRRTIFNINI